MTKKKFNSEYIAEAKKKLSEVMYEEPAAQDWTQFCLNVRQVMLAVATVYGNRCDEDTDKLRTLLTELVVGSVIPNIQKWDISYVKKN